MFNRRRGRTSDIIRLDHHSQWGQLIDRIKGKVTEKDIGCAILDKVENLCSITHLDREEFRKKMAEKEAMEWEQMRLEAKALQEKKQRPTLFTNALRKGF